MNLTLERTIKMLMQHISHTVHAVHVACVLFETRESKARAVQSHHTLCRQIIAQPLPDKLYVLLLSNLRIHTTVIRTTDKVEIGSGLRHEKQHVHGLAECIEKQREAKHELINIKVIVALLRYLYKISLDLLVLVQFFLNLKHRQSDNICSRHSDIQHTNPMASDLPKTS